jgi:hypothetical protein
MRLLVTGVFPILTYTSSVYADAHAHAHAQYK